MAYGAEGGDHLLADVLEVRNEELGGAFSLFFHIRTLCFFSAAYSNSAGTVTWVPAHHMGANFGYR